MKRIIISESMLKQLKESVLADAFPSVIGDAIKRNETPFGDNPYFMRNGGTGMGRSFLYKAAKSQFEDAKNALKKMGQIDSVKSGNITGAFTEIITKCQKIEQASKSELEKMAVNYVIKLFGVPDDTVKVEARLVGEVTGKDDISPVEPYDGDVNFELSDTSELGSLDGEIYKRQFLNAINMGAGMRMSENIRGYIDDLYDIDSRLPQLYKEAISLNNYMVFNSCDLGITDRDRKQVGVVDVKFGNEDELVTITAEGVIFPILLCELVRGFMELFSSHGLPKDTERAKYIISKTDFLKAEPWLMRVGPYMWNVFTESFEDTDTEDMPYIYQVISKLKPDLFFDVMSELLAKTQKGQKYAKKIKERASENKDRDSFNNRMTIRQSKKNVITDGYMSREEF